jgi:hypothetical protein
LNILYVKPIGREGIKMDSHPNRHDHPLHPQMTTLVEPYMYQTLQSLIGCPVVIDTVRDHVQGVLCQVFPDHAVVEAKGTYFFVRMQQVVWVMPQ